MGGAGADTFLFYSLNDLSDGADLIKDFEEGDRIDLSRMDANVNAPGVQHFTFVDHFTGTAGEANLIHDALHDRTVLRLDIDGDGHADGLIFISGDHTDIGDAGSSAIVL